MRTAWALRLSLLIVIIAVVARADEPPSAHLFLKYGAQAAENSQEPLDLSQPARQPVAFIKEEGERVHVTLADGRTGWISKTSLGTLDEVLADASAQLSQRPDDVELRLFRVELALRRSQQDDRQRAMADLVQLVDAAPQDPRPRLLRGTLLAKARQFEPALDDFTEVLKLDPNHAQARLQRGLALYAVREFEAALEDFEAHVKLEPAAAEGYATRAMAHVELGKFDQAEADFAMAIKLDDKLALPWFERARMWMRRHQASQAVKDLDETLKRQPSHLDATLFLATLLACGPDDTPRDGKRAVELAKAACERTGSRDFRPIEALAAAHAETGQFDQAIAEQQKALAVLQKAKAPLPAQAAAKTRLSQYRAGQPVRLMR